VTQDLARGRLVGLDGVNYLLKLGTDTRFALRAQTLRGPYFLGRISPGVPLLYGTSGVDQYSRLEPSAHPFLRIFGSGGGEPVLERVSLTLQAPAAQADCPCRIDFGPAYGTVTRPAASLTPGHAAPVSRTVTVPPHGYAQLNLTVRSRDGQPVPWVTLLSVRITNASPRP
jgi:hypothetical protein